MDTPNLQAASKSETALRAALQLPLEDWGRVQDALSPFNLVTGTRRPRVPPAGVRSRAAAVLVPVLLAPDGPQLLYTARSSSLRHHPGQISFPGGSRDPEDESLLETALREAREEINLERQAVDVVTTLEDVYIPPSNFTVTPYVGLIRGSVELQLDPREVTTILIVSLRELMSPSALRAAVQERPGLRMEAPMFLVQGHEIWGATAIITGLLLARLGWAEWQRLESA